MALLTLLTPYTQTIDGDWTSLVGERYECQLWATHGCPPMPSSPDAVLCEVRCTEEVAALITSDADLFVLEVLYDD